MPARVLIVDDHPSYRQRLSVAAASLGFDVAAECTHGEDALSFFGRQKAAIVIIDLHLGGEIDGLALCHLFVELDRQTLIVACSTFSDPDLMERAFDAGAHRCLRKPFSIEDAARLFENLATELESMVS
jgi:CheY-like chemotaxis protein